MSNLITAEELATILGLRPNTVKQWARAGIIPSLKLSAKVVRFDPVEVVEKLKIRALQSRSDCKVAV